MLSRVSEALCSRTAPMTPEIDLTVYPDECDAFGHLNQASFLSLFERARWEMLARGSGHGRLHPIGRLAGGAKDRSSTITPPPFPATCCASTRR